MAFPVSDLLYNMHDMAQLKKMVYDVEKDRKIQTCQN